MSGLLIGEQIAVIRKAITYDELGEPMYEDITTEVVDNVIVQPGSTNDLDSTRPNGVEVHYTLHFPKTYTDSLKGCSVEVQGTTYDVIGDPKPWMDDNTPGDYNRTVEVGVANG